MNGDNFRRPGDDPAKHPPRARPDVLVVAKLWPPMLESLHAAFTVHDRIDRADPAAFALAAPRIRAIAASGESKVSRELIAQLPALEIISVFGVGYDGIDVAAARERGVHVTHTPNVLNDEVADLAIGLMLAVARRIPQADRYVRDGKWKSGPAPLARKLSGARLGIVGLGRIGNAIARRAEAVRHVDRLHRAQRQGRFALPLPAERRGARRRGRLPRRHHARRRRHAQADRCQGARRRSARRATWSTSRAARSSTKPRSSRRCENGTIAGAGLDVFENEPNVPAALCALDNVVLTPHIGSATWQTRRAMADLAFGNLQAHFAGKPLLSPVPQ